MARNGIFLPSPWEAAICAELKQQYPQVVPRVPSGHLNQMRMLANECHTSARWYAQNDPTGSTRFVTGWWVQWPNFVLHSVIEQDGRRFCITPSAFSEASIEFIEDPKITWVEDGAAYTAMRDGQPIGVGVRAFPDLTIAQVTFIRDLLGAGHNPYEVCEVADKKFEKLLRERASTCRAE